MLEGRGRSLALESERGARVRGSAAALRRSLPVPAAALGPGRKFALVSGGGDASPREDGVESAGSGRAAADRNRSPQGILAVSVSL